MNTSTSSTTSSQTWSSYPIHLEGKGNGSKFQLFLNATRRQPLTNATLDDFCRHVPASQSTSLKIVADRDDLHELQSESWAAACRAMDQCPLSQLEYSTSFCRPGYQDTRVAELIQTARLAQLTQLHIHDGLYGYTETFLQLPKIATLETLVLKDVSYGKTVLDRSACEALAECIRSLPQLRSFTLWSACFSCRSDWEIVMRALQQKTSLEQVDFFGLRFVEDAKKTDFTQQVVNDPVFVEMKEVTHVLRTQYGAAPYSTAQRLDAVLQVRVGATVEAALEVNSTWAEALACISEDTELAYEFLRMQADPSAWAC